MEFQSYGASEVADCNSVSVIRLARYECFQEEKPSNSPTRVFVYLNCLYVSFSVLPQQVAKEMLSI